MQDDAPEPLHLGSMEERHRALTPSLAGALLEAAAVCLSRHHAPPCQLRIEAGGRDEARGLDWVVPDARVRDAWANAIDATEWGACSLVLTALADVRGLVAVRRAETGSGADYYVGPPGAGSEDLEDCLRLEVSGVDVGTEREVRKRLAGKKRQASDGNSSLPAVAGVVGFLARFLVIDDVEAPEL